MKRAWLGLLALGLIGCAGNSGTENSGQSSDEIIGGQIDTADPSVVAVYAAVPGAQKGGLCTGEVVAPTVVLTAAHCTLADEIGKGAVWHVIPGGSIKDVPKDQWLEVSKVDHDPAFSMQNPAAGHDIGVIVLKSPTRLTPFPVNTTPLTASLVGQQVRLVGYGLDNPFQQTGAGIKRQVTVPIDNIDDKVIETGRFLQGSCNGDSGGPAFMTINGRETIVGVTSYGLPYCLYHGYYTRVDLYSDWLRQYIQ